MASVAFVIPRQEGKDDQAKELVAALTGERGNELHPRRVAHGFQRIKIWHQDVPMKIAIVYLEADDLEATFANMAADGHEQNQWVGKMIENISGRHPHEGDTRPASRLVLDWHPEKGHSTTHH
jgi:hypothetical protein